MVSGRDQLPTFGRCGLLDGRCRDPARRHGSTQEALPVGRNAAGWSRYGLVNRVVQRRGEARSFDVLVRAIVPEPVFAWLEAADNWVIGRVRMCGGVFLERVVTTPDMATLGAPPQVQPPTAGRETLDAAGSARWHIRINGRRRHVDPGRLTVSERPRPLRPGLVNRTCASLGPAGAEPRASRLARTRISSPVAVLTTTRSQLGSSGTSPLPR